VRGSVELLARAGVRRQVDTVFFTGGSSGIPALRNSVSAMLPNARHVEGNIFGSIGSGLAIEAQALRRKAYAGKPAPTLRLLWEWACPSAGR
jgi:UDP-N-acetylglucosamine:LPS N-acetylglucosamine transferase